MMDRCARGGIDWGVTTWEGNRRAHMERWVSMSVDQILQAQEEMAEMSRDLARRRQNPGEAAGERRRR